MSRSAWRTVRTLPADLDINLFDRREMPPLGAGMDAARPARTPLANKVFDASGARLSTVPFTCEPCEGGVGLRLEIAFPLAMGVAFLAPFASERVGSPPRSDGP